MQIQRRDIHMARGASHGPEHADGDVEVTGIQSQACPNNSAHTGLSDGAHHCCAHRVLGIRACPQLSALSPACQFARCVLMAA